MDIVAAACCRKYVFIWCPRGDSNSHTLRYRLLRPTCLPFHHQGIYFLMNVVAVLFNSICILYVLVIFVSIVFVEKVKLFLLYFCNNYNLILLKIIFLTSSKQMFSGLKGLKVNIILSFVDVRLSTS